MKQLRLYCILTLFCITAAVDAFADDLQQGYGGIAWETSIDQLQGFEKVGAKGGVDDYIRPEVIHTVGSINVQRVVYGFYAGHFFAVYAQLDSPEAFAQARGLVQSRYGPPVIKFASGGAPSIYRWKEKNIKIKMKVDESSREMKLAYYFIPLSKKVNEALVENYSESSIQFLPIDPKKKPEAIPLLRF